MNKLENKHLDTYQPIEIKTIHDLSDELFISYIFKYISSKDLLATTLVCKRWNKLSNDPFLLTSRFLNLFSIKPAISNETAIQTLGRVSSTTNLSKLQEYLVSTKMNESVLGIIRIDHQLIVSLVDFNEPITSTKKIYDMKTGTLQSTINSQELTVICRVYENSLIIFNQNDSIQEINLKNFQETIYPCFFPKKSYLQSTMQFDNELVFGFANGLIQFFDLKSMKLTHSINAHRGSVRCILKHENFLFTAGEFGEIKKWNLETKELLFETEALDQRTICTLHIHQNTLFTGNNRGDLVMRHVNNLSFNKHLSTGNGTGTIDKILTYNQQLFFCSLDDESINIQNLETEKSVFCEKLQDMGHLMNIMVHPGELAVWGNHQKLAFFNINDHPKHPTQVIKTASNYCYDGKILITSNLDGYKKLVKVFVKYQED